MAQPMTSCMSEPMMASSTINHRIIRGTCTEDTGLLVKMPQQCSILYLYRFLINLISLQHIHESVWTD